VDRVCTDGIVQTQVSNESDQLLARKSVNLAQIREGVAAYAATVHATEKCLQP